MPVINRIKDFVPGLITLYAIPIYNIEKIVNEEVFIIDKDAYYRFILATDSLAADYEPVKSDEGEIYDHTITGFLPGESVVNTKVLNIIRKYRFLVIYQESDGTFRWLGNKDAGLQMNIRYNSGNRDNTAKGYNISFTGKLLLHAKPSKPYIRKGNTQIGIGDAPESSTTD